MKKSWRLGIPFLGLMFCILCGVLVEWDQIERKVIAWNSRRDIDSAQSRYDSLAEPMLLLEDQVLVGEPIRLYVEESHPHCIKGSGVQIYGSSDTYETILKRFSETLDMEGWTFRGSGISGVRSNYGLFDTLSVSLFPSTEAEFQQRLDSAAVTQEKLSQWKSQYVTLYGINIIYAEPQIVDCFF